ncbi:hypothetical protein ABPG75_005496 [Micractinium tetrahymenae]
MLRSDMRGAELSERDRHRLYCQLRLLRLLGDLPEGGGGVPHTDKSCISRAAEALERELRQLSEQANNLEGWRRADGPNASGLSLRERFEQFPVVQAEEGDWRWGRHCAYCRHDRAKHICMLKLSFSGQPGPVEWLVPELQRRGLLHQEGQPGIMHGVYAQMGGPTPSEMGDDDDEEDGEEDEEEERGSSSSSEDRQQRSTLRPRQQQRQQQPARKRRRLAARLFESDEEKEQQKQDEEQEDKKAALARSSRRQRTGRRAGQRCGHRFAGSSEEWTPGAEEQRDGSADDANSSSSAAVES